VPKGDQEARALEKIVLYPRTPGGRAIDGVTVDGKDTPTFTRDTVIIPSPRRGRELRVSIHMCP
jgi:hypothetical protein